MLDIVLLKLTLHFTTLVDTLLHLSTHTISYTHP